MSNARTIDRWTDEEVQALLTIFADDRIQHDFQSATRNEKVYARIVEKLKELDINHTVKQVREKLKKLKQDYKKIKDHNNRSGSERRTSKWYEQLDAILGHRPAYQPSETHNSATILLESMCTEPVEPTMEDSEQIQGKYIHPI